jgi:hypothetical protein
VRRQEQDRRRRELLRICGLWNPEKPGASATQVTWRGLRSRDGRETGRGQRASERAAAHDAAFGVGVSGYTWVAARRSLGALVPREAIAAPRAPIFAVRATARASRRERTTAIRRAARRGVALGGRARETNLDSLENRVIFILSWSESMISFTKFLASCFRRSARQPCTKVGF